MANFVANKKIVHVLAFIFPDWKSEDTFLDVKKGG
jgi:hypothetical protein